MKNCVSPLMEQKMISSTSDAAAKKMNPKVARPCFENEQYAPQNPKAMLYEGNATSALTTVYRHGYQVRHPN
jgi:hypothetical protein